MAASGAAPRSCQDSVNTRPSESIAMQKLLLGQATERNGLALTVSGADHDVPSNSNALPLVSAATQKVTDAQATDSRLLVSTRSGLVQAVPL